MPSATFLAAARVKLEREFPDKTATDLETIITEMNKRMRDFIAESPPFPDDLVVTYSITDRQKKNTQTMRITQRQAQQKQKEKWETVPSLTANRLKVGVLAQRATGTNVPPSQATSAIIHGLTVNQDKKNWNISWSAGKTPPKRVEAVRKAFAELGFPPSFPKPEKTSSK